MLSFKSPYQPEPHITEGKMTIFLAGSIENGQARDWQTEITEFLTGRDVAVFNPRRDDWDAGWVQSIENAEFKEQVQWEINNILAADMVVFYIQAGTRSPITLYELGLVTKDAQAKNKQVIVCCEQGFWREGDVDIVCEMFDIFSVKTIDELKQEIVKRVEELTVKPSHEQFTAWFNS
jgi:hypothetical protein